MGKTNWELRDWEPQPYLGFGENLYESDTHDFLRSFVSRKLRNRWHGVTEGTVSLLAGGGKEEEERERKKHNSHSVILEKLSAGTSKEIESVDDETSPAKRDKTLKKKLSHFLWRLFFKWLNANCGKRNRYTVDMFNYWATCSKKGFLNALNTSTGVFLSISSSDKILYSLI